MVNTERHPSWGKISIAAGRVVDLLTAGLLLVIIAITLAEVSGRYVISQSLVWSGELTRLLHVWMVLLAAARASHMRISLVSDRLPSGARLILRTGTGLISLVMLGILVFGGVLMMELTANDLYTGIPVSVSYVFLALVIGASVWAIRILADVLAGREY